ncbi:MAG: methyltransferase domain-containing protein [Solidesulfovibrio sp. DCME]|uniref:methyltransferase domain-containing protein n=1 Tax=Solidesulfovibrio sp. DCME TaxID=3447380 RepID=UPI003D0F9EC1
MGDDVSSVAAVPCLRPMACDRLALSTALATDELMAFTAFARGCALSGARVIEVGGAVPPEVVRLAGPASWTAVDPLVNPAAAGDGYVPVPFDFNRCGLPNASADLVFSCNAFHHMSPLDDVLGTIRRILVPGGVAWLHFGPIWSGPDGHHLDVTWRGGHYTFWGRHLLPHHAHLALEPEELGALLVTRLEFGLVQAVVHQVYADPRLNRVGFEGYLEAFARSGLTLCRLETSREVDYALDIPNYDGLAESRRLIADRVAKLGAKRDLNLREVLAVLRRPGQ